jgi:hypothetical protein
MTTRLTIGLELAAVSPGHTRTRFSHPRRADNAWTVGDADHERAVIAVRCGHVRSSGDRRVSR